MFDRGGKNMIDKWVPMKLLRLTCDNNKNIELISFGAILFFDFDVKQSGDMEMRMDAGDTKIVVDCAVCVCLLYDLHNDFVMV